MITDTPTMGTITTVTIPPAVAMNGMGDGSGTDANGENLGVGVTDGICGKDCSGEGLALGDGEAHTISSTESTNVRPSPMENCH
jgi:hypothetical protein